jgi:nucleoside-diphosphate-sugar epimerase
VFIGRVEVSSVSLFGSTGFIGTAFTNFSEHEVDGVDRNNPDPLFTEIVYAIGTTDNYNVFDNPRLDVESNLLKLISDLELMRDKFGTFSINYLSSWFVYGDSSKPPFRESQHCEPKGFYSISKLSAEMFLKSYCETFGIKYRILRLANVFGNGDSRASKKKNALQYLIEEIKAGRDVNVYEGGDFLRDYIDVRDVVRAIDLIIKSHPDGTIINVGTGNPTKFGDLLERAKTVFASESRLIPIVTPDFHRKVQVKDAYLDVSTLAEIGFIPRYSVLDEIINL